MRVSPLSHILQKKLDSLGYILCDVIGQKLLNLVK